MIYNVSLYENHDFQPHCDQQFKSWQNSFCCIFNHTCLYRRNTAGSALCTSCFTFYNLVDMILLCKLTVANLCFTKPMCSDFGAFDLLSAALGLMKVVIIPGSRNLEVKYYCMHVAPASLPTFFLHKRCQTHALE